MSIVNISVTDQTMKITNAPIITSGNENVDTIQYTFCEAWNGFVKTAVFYKQEDTLYYSMVDENNRCNIPNTILADEGVACIGVVGFKNDAGTYRTITTETLRYSISNGILNGYGINDPTLSELFYKNFKGAIVNNEGHLIITLVDDTTIDAGSVMGDTYTKTEIDNNIYTKTQIESKGYLTLETLPTYNGGVG